MSEPKATDVQGQNIPTHKNDDSKTDFYDYGT
jgi:hypothetical protein